MFNFSHKIALGIGLFSTFYLFGAENQNLPENLSHDRLARRAYWSICHFLLKDSETADKKLTSHYLSGLEPGEVSAEIQEDFNIGKTHTNPLELCEHLLINLNNDLIPNSSQRAKQKIAFEITMGLEGPKKLQKLEDVNLPSFPKLGMEYCSKQEMEEAFQDCQAKNMKGRDYINWLLEQKTAREKAKDLQGAEKLSNIIATACCTGLDYTDLTTLSELKIAEGYQDPRMKSVRLQIMNAYTLDSVVTRY